MRVPRPATAVLLSVAVTILASGCSTENVEERQQAKTSRYVDRQAARQIRGEARQQRTDAWFDRIMGVPVKSDDTGLRLP